MALTYWFWLGTIYLIWLTVQDFRNNMLVDDRRNWFMAGLSISVFSHVQTSLVYKLGLTFSIIILNIILRKTKAIGEADINSLSWVFLGLGLMHYTYVPVFLVCFIPLTLLWTLLKKIAKKEGATPFYHIILISFILSSWLLGGY
jgi:hypothetical protein